MTTAPLSEKLRPKNLDLVVGQEHLLGDRGVISRLIQGKIPLSIILWGPPGSGKTTIARLYARAFEAKFVSLSAVFSGVADLRKVVQEAQANPLFKQATVLFVDEIHRFNKAQQDAFLPYLEDGTLTLVGATTENPSFSLNNALLSRCRVLTLKGLEIEDLEKILQQYESQYKKLPLEPEAREWILRAAKGDGRYLLNLVENLEGTPKEGLYSLGELQDLLPKRAALFDRGGEGHYDLISALHKSVRGSDPDAALYWFCRMLEGGEDPLFLARRLIRMASEDVGLADPQALNQCIAARDAYAMLGSPEGELALAQAVVYLSLAPKSNRCYLAYGEARAAAKESSQHPPPKHILNAPTKLMKELDYGKGYVYDHDTPEGCSGQRYFPDGMDKKSFYKPIPRGFERDLEKRKNYFDSIRDQKRDSSRSN